MRKALISDFTGFLFLGAFRLAIAFLALPYGLVDLNFDVTFLRPESAIVWQPATTTNFLYNVFDEFRAKFSLIKLLRQIHLRQLPDGAQPKSALCSVGLDPRHTTGDRLRSHAAPMAINYS
jgi:hypothetical protein